MKYTDRQSLISPHVKKIPSQDAIDVASLEEGLEWVYWACNNLPLNISGARIQQISRDVSALFKGYLPGYLPCDTRYHDFGHTLRVLPPFCQLAVALFEKLPGTMLSRDLEWGLIALFLHESGYIRKKGDRSGTGAKYTFRHVSRSADFARRYLACLGYREEDLTCVEHMIYCTGVTHKPGQINFMSHGTRLVGYALGTSDLLSQMADPCYLDKLPLLFLEFQEAYKYEGPQQLRKMGVQPFTSCEELIQSTPFFFKEVVHPRLEAMEGLYRLLTDPETGTNPYLEKIQVHMEKIAQRYLPI